MVKVNEHSSLSVSNSLKNETNTQDHSSLFVSSSLKTETNPLPIESNILIDIVIEPSFPPCVSIDPIPSSLVNLFLLVTKSIIGYRRRVSGWNEAWGACL
jgi:hypothetical protein